MSQIKGTATTRPAGNLYLQTAYALLREYNPNMTSAQYYALLERADYDELEGFVGAEEYLTVAAEDLAAALWSFGLGLQENLVETVLFSTDPNADLAELRKNCEDAKLTNHAKGLLATLPTFSVHDTWVWNFQSHFYVQQFRYGIYRFMPSELAGYEKFEHDYAVYLEPLLAALHLDTSITYIKRAYANQQDTFLADHGISNEESLRDAILNLEYEPIIPDIMRTIREDNMVQNRLIKQVIEHNPILQV